MIGCGPAFAALIRKWLNQCKKRSSNKAQEYIRQGDGEIRMKTLVTIGSSGERAKRDRSDLYWTETHSSQEELAMNASHIVVKTPE